MQQFLILFREPDGRKGTHSPEAISRHRENWRIWLDKMTAESRLAGGMPLTLNGKIIHGKERSVSEGPHTVGGEIVGGYLLINATNLEEATTLIQSCPIFEFDGFVEVREIMPVPASPAGNETASTAKSLLSSSAEDSSTAGRNKEIVRRFNTSFIQEGDISAFHEIVDPGVVNHTAPPGISKGADGMLAVIELFRKALPDLEVKIIRQIAEDDLVITHKAFYATHKGELMGLPPTGRSVVIPVIDIVRLRDGKYIEHWGIRDMSALRS